MTTPTGSTPDTDSIAITRPPHVARTDFYARVQLIRDWFADLNPYQTNGSLLELEKVNKALTPAGKLADTLEPLYCLAVSPKRYALFNTDVDRQPVLRKASAHGLGHLLAPYNDDEAPADIPPPTMPVWKLGVTRWQYDLWYLAIHAELAGTTVDLDALPAFERPAISSYTISTQAIARWFRRHNQGKPYREQIRAFGFLISPVVGALNKPLGRASKPFHLVAPYDKTQAAWIATTYVDIYSDRDYEISTTNFSSQVAKVRTYRDLARTYLDHPDPRRLDSTGQQCRRQTKGWLRPRHIHAIHTEQIGKETNRLEEHQAGLVDNPADQLTRYKAGTRDPWARLVLPVLHHIGQAELRRRTGLSTSALAEILAGRARPHAANRKSLLASAQRHAVAEIKRAGGRAPSNRLAAMHVFTGMLASRTVSMRCAGCGLPITRPRATYCSSACRQKGYRTRASTKSPR